MDMEKQILKRIRGTRRALAVLSSHLEGLQERADRAYESGNVEQWEAYDHNIAWTQARVTVLIVRLDRLRVLVSRMMQKG